VSITAAEVAVQLGTEAHRWGLPVDLLAALLVEHALILRDISDCGIDAARARAALTVAADALPATGPGRVYTAYVRMLRGGERGGRRESDAQLARRDLVLPLRLHDAVRGQQLCDACDGESLNEAVAWEIAAATCSQLMREWALRTLLSRAARPLSV
jgi:hypothetical protein